MNGYVIQQIPKRPSRPGKYKGRRHTQNSRKVPSCFSIKQSAVRLGFKNEEFFRRTLLDHQYRPKWLLGCRKSSISEDRFGIDIFLDVEYRYNCKNKKRQLQYRTIKIQIKSSEGGKFFFMEKAATRGIFVVVVLPNNVSSEHRKAEIMFQVRKAYDLFRPKL